MLGGWKQRLTITRYGRYYFHTCRSRRRNIPRRIEYNNMKRYTTTIHHPLNNPILNVIPNQLTDQNASYIDDQFTFHPNKPKASPPSSMGKFKHYPPSTLDARAGPWRYVNRYICHQLP